MIIMKFGGTSVANFEAITRTIFIIGGKLDQKPVVVVSALSKVTDLLYRISDAAAAGNETETKDLLSQLRQRHVDLAAELLSQSVLKDEAVANVNSICDSLDSIAMAVCSLGELSDRNKAIIISKGEYLSSTIIAHAMNSKGIRTKWVDARDMMVTNKSYLKAEPDMSAIAERVPGVVSQAYEGVDAVITQGFVGVTADGEPTVLGRGGSDYSASLIGLAIDAERIEIWTDVDGVRTADPRSVKNTKYLEKISFEEAAEMAHFGAKVLHPLTIEPAVKKNIPIYVLNSMNPSGKGTAILRNELIFSESKVSVDLISTSEANISVTVDAAQNIDAVVAQLSEFADVIVDDDKSQVSVIGKNIVRLNGMLKKTFTPLKKCNVYMISQGASFVNISFVVDREELADVVQDLHDHLFDQTEELETF